MTTNQKLISFNQKRQAFPPSLIRNLLLSYKNALKIEAPPPSILFEMLLSVKNIHNLHLTVAQQHQTYTISHWFDDHNFAVITKDEGLRKTFLIINKQKALPFSFSAQKDQSISALIRESIQSQINVSGRYVPFLTLKEETPYLVLAPEEEHEGNFKVFDVFGRMVQDSKLDD
jgi:hypothetical protein